MLPQLLTTLFFLGTATPDSALERAPEPTPVETPRLTARPDDKADSSERIATALEKLAASIDALKADQKKIEEPKKADEKKDATWSGLVGLNMIWLTGNTNSLTTSASASVRRESERWIFQLKAGGAYGRTRATDTLDPVTGDVIQTEPEVVALNANLEARADLRFTSKLSFYLLAATMTDHVASIEARPVGEAGLSVLWIDQTEGDLSTLRLQTDFAFRGGKELRFQHYPTALNIEDEVIAAPRFAFAFRYALTEGLIFTEDFEVLPNVVGDSRVWLSSLAKLSVKLIKSLSFNIAFLVNHDTRPAEGKAKTDTSLTVGLELAF
ncbi:MAG: DUF481 domain-containing protein [Myxococcales bacterium]|jgi:hypothetical protein|nr:DUF481 domain-containing protein [Myxococcales bacterium]